MFGGLIALVAVAYFITEIPHTILFWAAFILTRSLGATLGDILTAAAHGGLNFDRIESSLVLAALMTLYQRRVCVKARSTWRDGALIRMIRTAK